jgi:hypothetical protein
VAVPAGSVDCVVSIVTYGNQLCQDHESQTKAITKSLLSEICRRYELELCLDAIKSDSKAKEKSKPCPTKEIEE